MKSNIRFLLLTALRDSRKNRGKLFMFMSSIILGITALVAINSFNYGLVKDIDRQAASLLGADIVASGNRPIDDNLAALLDSLPGESASEFELLSMAAMPKTNESQLVRIKALKGNFPFYGKLKTEPEDAAIHFRTSKTALVDKSLLIQQELSIGDSIKLGESTFAIIGELKNAFGNASIGSSFAPTIYIAQDYIEETELIRPGSLVNYIYYNKVSSDIDIDQWKKEHREDFRIDNIRLETISDRKRGLNRAFDSLNYFLNLVALVSLLLGCIGVASSVFIYVKTKIPSIAILRCIGMQGQQAFLVYFFQIVFLGFLGVIIGTALGSMIQVLLPKVLSDVLPFDVNLGMSWRAVFEGLGIGTVVTVLFALLPLLSVRRISPLRTLRASFEEDIKERDPWKLIVQVSIVLSLFGFLWILTKDALSALLFSLGLLFAFLSLYLMAHIIMWALKKYFPRSFSFVLRQGISNLYRPNNQTRTLLVSIGLGCAVLTTLFVIQGLLLRNVSEMDAGNQPNVVLYGIESDQRVDLIQLTKDQGLPIVQEVPVVTMRLDEWKGRSKAEWVADTTKREGRWAMHREARVTYREYLEDKEDLVAGSINKGPVNPGDSIWISLGESYAEALEVGLGDELIFNVQGTRIKTFVGSLRKIDFANMKARFFIVFPLGVLEKAPQFHVLVTKTSSPSATANYRREVVKTFPNVSVIDLGMILEALSDILAKVSYVIKFMAGFSILTGLIVLISSLLLSKFHRIRESVLLRTMGASRSQILWINATEYIILGTLAAANGIVISLLGSFLLAKYQLKLDFIIQWGPILLVFVLIVMLTLVIGLLNSRDVVTKSPLEVLRKEV